jgi:hypothetical protein
VYFRVAGLLGSEVGGAGRPSREAANASPGASKVTVGIPKVIPRRLLTAPPSEWPVSQMFESGYNSVTLVNSSTAAR